MGVLFPLKQLTSLFKALSEATRLRIVHLLHAQSLCVRDLQEVLGLSQPLVSRHLAILRAANLVRTSGRGPESVIPCLVRRSLTTLCASS